MLQLNNEQELKEKLDTYEYVFVKVFSPTCGPCKQIQPILDELETQYTQVQFFSIDGASNRDWAVSKGIRTVPHFLLYHKTSGVSYALSGTHPKEKLEDFINQLFKDDLEISD